MIESPVLITGCARSGTTLLYRILSESPELWSIGIESKAIIEHFHHPSEKGWESGELSADDLNEGSRKYILDAFQAQSASGSFWRRTYEINRRIKKASLYSSLLMGGRREKTRAGTNSAIPGKGLSAVRAIVKFRNAVFSQPERIRLLDKSPEHCLRLPFLSALFKDARIITITRDGRANVHSLLEGWRHPHLFPGYKTPEPVSSPGQTRGRWAFTLIPGWRELINHPLEEICARQWVACNAAILDYSAARQSLPTHFVRYEDLVNQPTETLMNIATFLNLNPEDIPAIGNRLPEVNTVSSPAADKWWREEMLINRIEPILAPIMDRLGYQLT